jgi:DNA-binding MarR family transcriptional regulator
VAFEPLLETLVSLSVSLAELEILMLLEDGDATSQDLADHLGYPAREVIVTTSSLERRGLIRRRWRDGPMRGCFTITDAGQAPLQRLANTLSSVSL